MKQIQDLRKINIFKIDNTEDCVHETLICQAFQVGDSLACTHSMGKYLIPNQENLLIRASLAKKSPLEFLINSLIEYSFFKVVVVDA